MAFAHLLGAFSLVINQFQSISWFAAVIVRLGALMEAMDKIQTNGVSAIEYCEQNDKIIYEQLTLRSPRDGRTLVKDLSISIPVETRLLIRGADDTAKLALFRASAGIWHTGQGKIMIPGCDDMLFLPEHPYLPPGTLRQLCVRANRQTEVSENRILEVLQSLELSSVVTRVGGIDQECDWNEMLSLGELQLLAVVRVCLAMPRFAFLDRLGTAMTALQVEHILELLTKTGITYLTIGNREDKETDYDAVLSLAGDGSWEMRQVTQTGYKNE